jgi:hypothetical protein
VFVLLRPFLDEIINETRRIAELLSQLPAEVGVFVSWPSLCSEDLELALQMADLTCCDVVSRSPLMVVSPPLPCIPAPVLYRWTSTPC